MERSKFAPEVPLQLLLLLLLLWVSYERGALGEEIYEVEHRMVGETLTVRCQYTALKPDHLEKAWCKKKRNTNTCTLLITRPKPLSKTENPRYSLSYNTSVIMVNMSDLQVEDSGEYWCGNNNSTVNVIAIFKRIHLIVAPAQTQNTTPLNSDTAVKSTTMIEDLTITSSTIRPQFKATVVTDIQLPENSTSRSQVVDHVVSEDLRFPNCLLTLVVFGLLLIKGLAFLVLLILLFRFRNQGNGDSEKVAELNKVELSKISPYISY